MSNQNVILFSSNGKDNAQEKVYQGQPRAGSMLFNASFIELLSSATQFVKFFLFPPLWKVVYS